MAEIEVAAEAVAEQIEAEAVPRSWPRRPSRRRRPAEAVAEEIEAEEAEEAVAEEAEAEAAIVEEAEQGEAASDGDTDTTEKESND